MTGRAYFRHLGSAFLILPWAILYSRRQSRPARQLRYLTSSATLHDGEEDIGFSNAKYVNSERSALKLRVLRRRQDRSFPLRTGERMDYTCQVYGVAMSGINWKKSLWAIR